MSSSSFSPIRWILVFASKLRFPQLFLLIATIFGLDLLIPDVIPFVDEILLGLVTTLLGSLKKKKEELPRDDEPPTEN